ncbi:MAG: VOC family protein [Candidatus Sumerlaeia bacterium]|nr:VOC family protein [Candidatus Sumerlaeia bacterium]
MPPVYQYRPEVTCAMGVSDLAASLAWFRDVLGFEKVFESVENGWAEVATATPGVTVGMSQVEEPKVEGGATLVFAVTDIEAAKSELEAKGVRFDGGIMEIPGMVKLATFFDRDGHKFMFSQSLM